MTDQLAKDVEETASVVIAQSALTTSLIGVLRNLNILDQADVNSIFDLALVGLETANHSSPKIFNGAREILERDTNRMGGNLD